MTTQQSIKELVDQYFQPLIYLPNVNKGSFPSADQAPGGICGVFYGGINYYFSFGSIDDNGTLPGKNTVFGIGSVTKTFTTSILGQSPDLFDEPANNYLPPGYTLTGNEVNATFAQLASFTGGIVPSVPPQGDGTTQQQFINFINSRNPKNIPSPNVYSNSSIGFIGQMLMYQAGYTNFDGADADQWWSDNLFTALSMFNSGYPAKTDADHHLSTAYKFVNNAYAPTDYSSWTPWGTAGRAFSTCRDMMKFIRANCGETVVNGKTVPENILTGMANAQKNWAPPENPNSYLRQGFAWIIADANHTDPICGKAGGVPGVSSFVTVCPTLGLGVVFLTNMQGIVTQPNAMDLTRALQQLTPGENS